MAEIGLLAFARVALQVARSILTAYEAGSVIQQFNQPQLLAVLCLMRYEGMQCEASDSSGKPSTGWKVICERSK